MDGLEGKVRYGSDVAPDHVMLCILRCRWMMVLRRRHEDILSALIQKHFIYCHLCYFLLICGDVPP